jgi:hypothetical protein
MSGPVDFTRRLRWIVLGLGLLLPTCGDEQRAQCQKPADCVGKEGGNYCKVIMGKGRCVIECLPGPDGKDNCPPLFTCTGHADDGSLYCTQ